ncbi:SDR family oxidoreductase [Paenibacillus sp. R14(2021)]|uniref:SDR family oxidoreductase n=1 Tax=Paenibacillus sp. R14(2021) TaxID=2859228 RepID=UPI001C613A09|nr:SDR family oxidoreductase [Paenibacillus sp. R14(2021)]
MSAAILVIGATGTTGKELVKLLAKNGHKTRVTVRPTSNTSELQALGVELVQADLNDVDTLVQAMNGIQKVYFATPLVPNMVELSSSIIRAANKAAVKHLVKLSGGGADMDTMAKWHRAVEKEIEQSGMAYTFLQSNTFMQNFIKFNSRTIRAQGAFYEPYGEGKSAYIDASDIAQVAYRVLTEEGHANKAYYLSGPEALSGAEIADILSSVTGKSIKFIDAPVEAASAGMQKAGMPAEIVEALLEHYQMMKLGHTAGVSSTVEEITGQKATSFETFAQANKEAFIG